MVMLLEAPVRVFLAVVGGGNFRPSKKARLLPNPGHFLRGHRTQCMLERSRLRHFDGGRRTAYPGVGPVACR